MSEHIVNSTGAAIEEVIETAKKAEMPKEAKALLLDGLKKSQETYTKFTALTKDTGKNYEDLLVKVQSNTRQIGETLVANMEKNSQSAFESAKAILDCKDIEAATKLQTEFAQKQFSAMSAQVAELIDLSTKAVQDLTQAGAKAAEKTTDSLKSIS